MNATSLPEAVARTPTCHSFFQPGALSALAMLALVVLCRTSQTYQFKKDGEYLKRNVASLSST